MLSGQEQADTNVTGDEIAFSIDNDISEDEWIIRALWFESNGFFEQSGLIYSGLYEVTEKKEYLFKEVSSSIYGKSGVGESLKKLKEWSEKNPDDLIGRRLLIALYMNEQSFQEAEKVSTYLLKHSNEDADLELASNPYLFLGKYDKAIALLDKLYKKTKNETILIRIAVIEAQYLKNSKKAIQLLETHRRLEDASEEVYKLLIDLYVKEQDLDNILEIYKALYSKYPEKEYLNKIVEIYIYNQNFDSLIKFLESNHAGDLILYDLYKKEERFKEAKALAEKFHLKDGNPKWLAEKAILLYESSEEKENKKLLERVLTLFDDALTQGVDDSIYFNYYGYTLIDKEIDIDKGIKIIRRALEQQPNNSFYLDSLAWGYYKKHECLKAYKTMERVVDAEGLEEDEIKDHWEKIQECQKPVIVGIR